MLIYIIFLVPSSAGEQVQKILPFFQPTFPADLLHPLLADRLTSRSVPIQKAAPHANIQELRPSVKSASHLSVIRVY